MGNFLWRSDRPLPGLMPIRLTGGPLLIFFTQFFFLALARGLLREGASPQQIMERTKNGNSPRADQQPEEEPAGQDVQEGKRGYGDEGAKHNRQVGISSGRTWR